ncbi:IclR family transcriptional regulator [Variovorax sp. 2RAF20]
MACPKEQVTSVSRALDLLDAFGIDEPHLGIGVLARRTGLAKTTALRLARTLESKGYMVQMETGSWRLGPASAWLAARYQVAFDLQGVAQPMLRELAATTGHDALLFVRERNARVRLMRAEVGSKRPVSPMGERMPLERGSAGKVILAFSDAIGELFDEIRGCGFHVTIGETYSGVGSVSAPVFDSGWSVVGALTLSFRPPVDSEETIRAHAPVVMDTAQELSRALMRSGQRQLLTKLPRGQWHP